MPKRVNPTKSLHIVGVLLKKLRSGGHALMRLAGALERIALVYALLSSYDGGKALWGLVRVALSRFMLVYRFQGDDVFAVDGFLRARGYCSGVEGTMPPRPATAAWHMSFWPAAALWYHGQYGDEYEVFALCPLAALTRAIDLPTGAGAVVRRATDRHGRACAPCPAPYAWQKALLAAVDCREASSLHILICGTPGSGKTTFPLIWAETIVQELAPQVMATVVQGGCIADASPGIDNPYVIRGGSRYIRSVHVLDEVEGNLRDAVDARGAPTSGRFPFIRFLDSMPMWNYLVATTNRALSDFAPWFLRRFHFLVEVVAHCDADEITMEHRIHRGHVHGVMPQNLLYQPQKEIAEDTKIN